MFFASFKLIFSAFSLTTSTKIWQNLKNKMIICDFYTSIVMLRKHRTSLEKIKKIFFEQNRFTFYNKIDIAKQIIFQWKSYRNLTDLKKKVPKIKNPPKKISKKTCDLLHYFFGAIFSLHFLWFPPLHYFENSKILYLLIILITSENNSSGFFLIYSNLLRLIFTDIEQTFKSIFMNYMSFLMWTFWHVKNTYWEVLV